jgi:SAM-dependent methyltransferase
VDLDAAMVAEGRAANRPVVLGDAVAHLRSLADGSVGAVTSFQVVEHLELTQLIALLDEAFRVLRPGGVLIAETPNPASLVVLGRSFILDPSHVWPLHPSLLTFLVEQAGFRSSQSRFFAPSSDDHLPLVHDPRDEVAVALNAGFEHLNEVLFGPQDYAVVARKGT